MRPLPFNNDWRGGEDVFAGKGGIFTRLEKGYGCAFVDIALAHVCVVGSAFAHLRSGLDSMWGSKDNSVCSGLKRVNRSGVALTESGVTIT